MGFPGGPAIKKKKIPVIQGMQGSISGLESSSEEGKCNILQYSCLENPMVKGEWWATICGVARVGHDLVTKPPYLAFRLEKEFLIEFKTINHERKEKFSFSNKDR